MPRRGESMSLGTRAKIAATKRALFADPIVGPALRRSMSLAARRPETVARKRELARASWAGRRVRPRCLHCDVAAPKRVLVPVDGLLGAQECANRALCERDILRGAA